MSKPVPCDFCGADQPSWSFCGADPQLDTELGPWLACETCAAAIRGQKWDALVKRYLTRPRLIEATDAANYLSGKLIECFRALVGIHLAPAK